MSLLRSLFTVIEDLGTRADVLDRRVQRGLSRARRSTCRSWCAFCGRQRTCASCKDEQRKSMEMFDALMGADVMGGLLDAVGGHGAEMQMFAGRPVLFIDPDSMPRTLTLPLLNEMFDKLRVEPEPVVLIVREEYTSHETVTRNGRTKTKVTKGRRPFGWM